MIDYDAEAGGYDASRGGEARAAACADAVERLLPETARSVVDVACGTGIVTRRLRRTGREVLGVDRSYGMAALASARLPNRVVSGDAAALPIESDSADAVIVIWLLHLLDDAAPAIAEAARVLRAGGVLVTTVDKNQADFAVESDVAALTAPTRRAYEGRASDHFERVTALAAGHGLRLTGETAFPGVGQGRGPRQWRDRILTGRARWTTDADVAELCERLAALPDQDTPRPDPIYRLVAFSPPTRCAAGAGPGS